jgi:hypothetical protein
MKQTPCFAFDNCRCFGEELGFTFEGEYDIIDACSKRDSCLRYLSLNNIAPHTPATDFLCENNFEFFIHP